MAHQGPYVGLQEKEKEKREKEREKDKKARSSSAPTEPLVFSGGPQAVPTGTGELDHDALRASGINPFETPTDPNEFIVGSYPGQRKKFLRF